MAQIEMSFQEPEAKITFGEMLMNKAIFRKETKFHYIGETNYEIQNCKEDKSP